VATENVSVGELCCWSRHIVTVCQ